MKLGIAWLAVFLFIAVAGANETRLIPLKHRTAAEIIPLIQPLLGSDDALTGTDYRLIVRTSEKNFREIERLLPQIDVARASLRITVEQVVADDRDRTRHSISGEIKMGDRARVTLPDSAPNDGGLTVEKNGLRYRTIQRATTSRDATTQTLLTLDGQRSYIRVGQSIPHVTKILAISPRQWVLVQGIDVQRVTTGFEVLPRVRGDRILLEITPRLSSLQNPATGLVNFQELSTTVETRRGEWIDLGQILGHRGEIERTILDSASATGGERRTVRLKID